MNDNYIYCETRDIYNSLDLIDTFDFCYHLLNMIIACGYYDDIDEKREHLKHFVETCNIMEKILKEKKYNKEKED